MALSSRRTSSVERTVTSSSWQCKFTFSIPPKEKRNPKYVVAKDVSAFVAAAAYVNFRIECANEEDHAGAGPHGHRRLESRSEAASHMNSTNGAQGLETKQDL